MIRLSEEALQRIATRLGSQCHVWEGVGARDIEEVLKLAREEAALALSKTPIFEQVYDGESIIDMGEDVSEACLQKYNPKMKAVPSDEHGFMKGSIKVTIEWSPEGGIEG